MDKKHAKQRIEELSKSIEGHNERYYVQSQPAVSDAEYDALFKFFVTLFCINIRYFYRIYELN